MRIRIQMNCSEVQLSFISIIFRLLFCINFARALWNSGTIVAIAAAEVAAAAAAGCIIQDEAENTIEIANCWKLSQHTPTPLMMLEMVFCCMAIQCRCTRRFSITFDIKFSLSLSCSPHIESSDAVCMCIDIDRLQSISFQPEIHSIFVIVYFCQCTEQRDRLQSLCVFSVVQQTETKSGVKNPLVHTHTYRL